VALAWPCGLENHSHVPDFRPWSSALTISAAPKPSTTTTSNTSSGRRSEVFPFPVCAPLYRRNRYTDQTISRNLSTFSTASSPEVSRRLPQRRHHQEIHHNTSAPEIDVDVKKVRSKRCDAAFRARVDFYMVYSLRRSQRAEARSLHRRTLSSFQNPLPNELIPINPLGLSVTYFARTRRSSDVLIPLVRVGVAGGRLASLGPTSARHVLLFPKHFLRAYATAHSIGLARGSPGALYGASGAYGFPPAPS